MSRQPATRLHALTGHRTPVQRPTGLGAGVRDGQAVARRGLAVMCLAALAALAVAGAAASAAQSTGEPAARPAGQPCARTLTVFAAASLTESFGKSGKPFEASHAGAGVSLSFAGCQQLRAQLEDGVRADVFASAKIKELTNAVPAALVVSGTQRTFARNRLIVIFPHDNPARIGSLADLARPHIKLDLADKTVPVGQYAKVG